MVLNQWKLGGIREVIMCLCLLNCCLAQPLTPTERFLDARGKGLDSYYGEAIIELDALSEEYPGTDLDALSRFEKARILLVQSPLRTGEAQSLYSQLKTDFSGTAFEVYADQQSLDLELHRGRISIDQFVNSIDQLIVRVGGTSIHSLSDPVSTPNGVLDENQQKLFLEETYLIVASRILETPDEELTQDNVALAKRIVKFHRANFTAGRVARGLADRISFIETGEIINRPDDFDSPVITALLESRIEPNSFLSFTVHDGPSSGSQLDLSKLSIALDGGQLPKEAFTVSGLDSSTDIFEPFEIRVKPQAGWTVGEHSLLVSVSDFDENSVEQSVLFTVAEDLGFLDLRSEKDTTLLRTCN